MVELVGALAVLVGGISSLVVSFFFERRAYHYLLTTIEAEKASGDRIETLIRNLNQANDVIREIEIEIRERTKLAEKLQADAEQAERLLDLNHEELEAVRGLVGSELRRESKRGFWLGALVNFLFFVGGIGVTLLLA
jgi:hypothetical protein